MAKRRSGKHPVWCFVFFLYAGIMIWLLFFRERNITQGISYWDAIRDNMNLKLLYTIDNYVHVIFHHRESAYFTKCVIELLGNVFMFVPAGWLLPKLFPAMKKILVFFISAIGIIVFIEAFQLFTLLGFFDVDDILLNIFGMYLGFVFYHITAQK